MLSMWTRPAPRRRAPAPSPAAAPPPPPRRQRSCVAEFQGVWTLRTEPPSCPAFTASRGRLAVGGAWGGLCLRPSCRPPPAGSLGGEGCEAWSPAPMDRGVTQPTSALTHCANIFPPPLATARSQPSLKAPLGS